MEAFETKFDEISELLLNGVVLYVNNKPYRFAEIEFYWNGGNHQGEGEEDGEEEESERRQ